MSKWIQKLEESLSNNSNSVTDVLSGQNMTYDEIYKRGLIYGRDLNLEIQTIVPVLLPNSVEYLITYIACATHGLIFAPIPYFLDAVEVDKLLENYKSKLIVSNREDISYPVKLIQPPNLKATDFESELFDHKTNVIVSDSSILSLYYSSGTTGNPKGVLYTHENKFSLIESIVNDFGFTKESNHFAFLPFGHTASLNYSVFPSLFLGSKLFIASGFEKIRSNFFQILAKFKITYVELVPTVAQTLIKLHEDVSKLNLTNISFIGCGSAPLSKTIQNEFYSCFQKPLANLYGLSETGPSHFDNPLEPNWKPGSIGKPLTVNNCKIADDGEILLRGKNVMLGYFNNDKLTNEVVKDGWFHTGDYGFEQGGNYYFLDRKKDLIILGGINIYPAEIEDVIYKESRVLECAVFGVEDKTLGEKIVAYIKCSLKGHDNLIGMEADLIDLCKKHLSRFKIPSVIVFVDEIPKTVSGKILRRSLKELHLQKYHMLDD
jgi:long-chain acyl-CoA synthetase